MNKQRTETPLVIVERAAGHPHGGEDISGAPSALRRACDYVTIWIAVFCRFVWRLEDEQLGRYSVRYTAFVAHVNAQTVAQIRTERRSA
jgi:hypothetical protein